jgi:hypothetical protein
MMPTSGSKECTRLGSWSVGRSVSLSDLLVPEAVHGLLIL